MLDKDKLWRTWDRSPSEPNLRDYTYLAYKGEKIWTFDVLDFRLTGFLNEKNVVVNGTISAVVEAYKRFDKESSPICTTTSDKIKILEESRALKIKQLGEKIAQELKELYGETNG